MHEATPLWEGWQALVSAFAPVFTQPGWVRFGPWLTSMVLCGEEPILTPLLTALGWESRWRVLAHCAEYGAWAAELWRHADAASTAPIVGVCEGAYFYSGNYISAVIS
jgi:hypothetical protein